MKLLIIIPAYNEAGNIQRVVDNLNTNFPQFDYVIINDGSQDETASICRKNNYNMVDLPVNIGLAGGFQAGMKYALRHGYDCAIQFDGDGQHNPEFIDRMLLALEKTNADVVIGSRFKERKKNLSFRMLGNSLIGMLIRLTTGKRLTDSTSGMRLFNKSMIKRLAKTLNYGPEPDTISFLIRCGARVEEVQADMQERVEGESYLNITRSIRYMLYMCSSILIVQQLRKRDI